MRSLTAMRKKKKPRRGSSARGRPAPPSGLLRGKTDTGGHHDDVEQGRGERNERRRRIGAQLTGLHGGIEHTGGAVRGGGGAELRGETDLGFHGVALGVVL